MKPATAAAKLGVYLPATPADFQGRDLTREELNELQRTPPPWLVELRRQGPFPRDVVAQKLRISRAALARHDVPDGLDADQIGELLDAPPPWLLEERRIYTASVEEKERAKQPHLRH